MHRINSLGKSEGSWKRAFEPGSPQLSGMVFCQLPQAVRHLVAVPLRSLDIKKPLLGRGSFEIETMCGSADDLETHHFGHRAQVGVQIGMEGSVVVVNGAIGVFESVACEHANHRRSCRHFIFAFEQTCH